MVKERPESMKEMAVQLYNETGSAYKVASKMGVSHKAVYRMLHEKGVDVPGWNDPKPNRRKFSGELAEKMIADYLSGMTWPLLLEKYGRHESAMREAIRRAGYSLKDRGGQRRPILADEAKKIIELRESGHTHAAIATKLGRNQTAVSRHLKTAGVDSGARHTGEKHGSWKGGKSTTGGYVLQVMSADHPFAPAMRLCNGYVLQHRLVMAKHLGRALTKYESVHHINGDRKDNRIENLQLRYGSHGKGKVLTCRCCGSHDILAEGL